MNAANSSICCISIKFKESSYLISSVYNLHFFSNILYKKFILNIKQGKNLFTCQSFQNIWTIEWLEFKIKEKIFFSTFTKILKSNNKLMRGDFFEIWEYSIKNRIKRKNLFYFPNIGEIWDHKWIESLKPKNGLGCLIICYGFKLFLVNVPLVSPQFIRIVKIFYHISLVNIYQWKMSCKYSNIVTGDLRGNIIIYDLFNSFSWTRLFHNSNKNTPISIIKIFLYPNVGQKLRYLISGGYDGIVKIWDLEETKVSLVEIYFPKRWITNIQVYSNLIENNFLLINFDNGFLSFVCILTKKLISTIFGHQLSLWDSIIEAEIFVSVGEDGNLNMIEINGPFHLFVKALIFLSSSKHLLKTFLNIKTIASCLQSVEKNFSLKTVSNCFINKNFIMNFAGTSGILIFYNFNW